MNYCLMCGRVQPTKTLPHGHRLTSTERKTLLLDIQDTLQRGKLDRQALATKYHVSPSTITYWKKKLITR